MHLMQMHNDILQCSIAKQGDTLSTIVTTSSKKRRIEMKSFVEVAAESHFSIQNLPYGIFSTSDNVCITITAVN